MVPRNDGRNFPVIWTSHATRLVVVMTREGFKKGVAPATITSGGLARSPPKNLCCAFIYADGVTLRAWWTPDGILFIYVEKTEAVYTVRHKFLSATSWGSQNQYPLPDTRKILPAKRFSSKLLLFCRRSSFITSLHRNPKSTSYTWQFWNSGGSHPFVPLRLTQCLLHPVPRDIILKGRFRSIRMRIWLCLFCVKKGENSARTQKGLRSGRPIMVLLTLPLSKLTQK